MAQEIPAQVLLLMVEKFRMLSEPTRLMILRTLMTEGELVWLFARADPNG